MRRWNFSSFLFSANGKHCEDDLVTFFSFHIFLVNGKRGEKMISRFDSKLEEHFCVILPMLPLKQRRREMRNEYCSKVIWVFALDSWKILTNEWNGIAVRKTNDTFSSLLLTASYLNNFKNYFSMMMFVRETAHKYCAVMMNNRLLEIFTLRRKKN